MKMHQNSQWEILALLRFFLAITVVVGHYALLVKHDSTKLFGDAYLNPGSAVFGFFILSGFSIAASIKRDAQQFYRRRAIRIWPLYIATILFGLAVEAFIAPQGMNWPLGAHTPAASWLSIIASFLMLQSIISYPIPIVGPIWSLSAEWWHYMFAPFFAKLSNVILIALALASLIAYLLIVPPIGHGIDYLQYGLAIATSSWFWLTGFIYHRLQGTPIGFVILCLPSVFALTLGHFTGAPLFISIFVLVLSSEIKLPPTVGNVFNFLGDLSFPTYLFHWPILTAAVTLGLVNTFGDFAAVLLVSLAALYLVDYPSRQLFSSKKHPSALPSHPELFSHQVAHQNESLISIKAD